jgi:GTPase SAR1 family protein
MAQRQVSTEEAQSFAKEHSMLYFETSAKTGENIVEAFDACLAAIAKNADEGAYRVDQNQPGDALDLENEEMPSRCDC